jgi:hypothetical protein
MKSLLLIVTASLMLVGRTVAVGIPNVVQGAPSGDKWCQDFFPGDCFQSKGECKKTIPEGLSGTCIKNPLKP